MDGTILEHDPEKWVPVFGKDHAPPKRRVAKVRVVSTSLAGLVLRRRTDVGYSRHRHLKCAVSKDGHKRDEPAAFLRDALAALGLLRMRSVEDKIQSKSYFNAGAARPADK